MFLFKLKCFHNNFCSDLCKSLSAFLLVWSVLNQKNPWLSLLDKLKFNQFNYIFFKYIQYILYIVFTKWNSYSKNDMIYFIYAYTGNCAFVYLLFAVQLHWSCDYTINIWYTSYVFSYYRIQSNFTSLQNHYSPQCDGSIFVHIDPFVGETFCYWAVSAGNQLLLAWLLYHVVCK